MKRLILLVTSLIASFTRADASIDEGTFHSLIDKVTSQYSEQVSSLGGVLDVRKRFNFEQFVAVARRSESQWIVEFWGGYPKALEMSPDAFSLLVCHEFGHHLGGAPYYEHPHYAWSSAEGQADVFSVSQCLPQLWQNDLEGNEKAAAVASPQAQLSCGAKSGLDYPLCLRTLDAAFQFSLLVARLQKNETPVWTIKASVGSPVPKTEYKHSTAQCRFETFLLAHTTSERAACWYAAE